MLTEAFYWVLNMSLVGALMGGVVLGLRSIRGFPRGFACALWLAPLVRFWLPFALPGKYSLMALIARFTTHSIPSGGFVYTNVVMGAQDYFPLAFKTEVLARVFRTASFVWIAGFGVVLTGLILLYTLNRMRVRSAERLSGNVYVSDRVTSPAVYGVFRPRILLPPGMAETEQKYILLHEQAHIRRGDNLWRMLALVTVCLHWFNPLAWVFLKYFLGDMELACDARVLHSLPEAERKAYAHALLNCAEQRGALVSAFGGAKLRRRVEGVLSYRPLTLASALCFTALTAAVLLTLLTNAQG
jgi:beta-lactamase regulating signal transducer with metallopeptidase domain